MKFRTAYSPSLKVTAPNSGLSRTKQSFKKECDINFILAKYRKTGLIDHLNTYQGNYSDLSNPVDYQTAMNIIINADMAFSTLPSEIRSKFNNDPHAFLTFVSDPKNEDSMIELGLKKRPETNSAAAPGSASVADPGAAAPTTGGE